MKLSELKPGDWIKVNDEGIEREGTIVRVSQEEHEICVDNGIQEIWFRLADIKPIPLDATQLQRLGFQQMEADKGIKFGKDAFRVWFPAAGDFNTAEVWYREDRRHFNRLLMVHELQNLHLQMTKVSLDT